MTLLANAFGAGLAALVGAGGPGGGCGTPPPCFHAVAFVNDSLSHGLVGDGLLSLNEAILLHNGTLQFAQLSAAEQQQLSLIPGTGSTTDVTWIDIDGSNTPVITIEQNLAPVLDTTFGLLIKGFSDPPVLDFTGPGITQGLVAPTNAITIEDVVFLGGPFGLDVTQADVTGQPGCVVAGVRFEGQAQFGLRVVASGTGVGRVIVEQCEFVNCPTAITVDESPAGRTTIFEAHQVDVAGAAVGIDATIGGGGSTRYTFDRVTIDASVRGIRLARGAGADRSAYVEGSFVRVRAPDAAILQCHPTALTWALLHLWDLRGANAALQLGAPGAALFGEATELVLDGPVAIGVGGASQPFALRNLRCRNGAVALATTGTQSLTIAESRFDACTVTNAGSAPIAITTSCFVGGSLAGTAAAPFVASDSHVGSAGAHVQLSQPLTAPQLGSMAVVPDDVTLGATVQFVADLPPGLLGVFALGFTDPTPTLVPSLALYFEPTSYVFVPGVYSLQQAFAWSVPSSSVFTGFDLVVHLAVLPAGIQAPWLQLPPPTRFVLR